jgi:CHAT domain-containing protein/Tfp pilus assembly protein PilF
MLGGTALALLSACGCGPLVGVRATVRVDEQTRLEREVLGARGEVAPQVVLLSVEADGRSPDQWRELSRAYLSLEERLSSAADQTPELRAWHVVALHNRGAAAAGLGDGEQARTLLEEALARARAYGFATLEWQILAERAALDAGPARLRRLREAEEAAFDAPLLGKLDHDLEDARRRGRLYAQLVAGALSDGNGEAALRYAARRQALALARAVRPDDLSAPGGDVWEAALELAGARAAAAEARQGLCRLPFGTLEEPAPPAEAFAAALERLSEVRAAAGASSPLGGLLVPEPVDLLAVQEMLPADGALLVFEPLGGQAYAVFLLREEAFAARRTALPPEGTHGASVRRSLEGTASAEALERLGSALIGPFAEELRDGVRRIYLACPAGLTDAAWQALPFDGATLGERFEVAFLGGMADLQWAFQNKSYGRESVLLCGGWPGGLEAAAQLLDADADVSLFDVRRRVKDELPLAMAFADVVFFANPLRIRPAAPARSHLAFPGELSLLSGVPAPEFASYRTRASCLAFAAAEAGAFERDSFASLRVFTRAALAAGAPTVLYGTGAERVPGAGEAFWRPFLKLVRIGPASQAHREALAALLPAYRPAFRLYGFAGMNEREYEEFSRLEFSDLARSAAAHLEAGRFREAAADLMDLANMAGALPLESEPERWRLKAQVQRLLVRAFRALGEYDRAVRHQRLVAEHLRQYEGQAGPLTAVAYQSLGALLTEAERFEEAADAYRRCLGLLREHGDGEQVAAVLGELGKSLDRASEYEQALETFRQALDDYQGLRRPEGVARQHQRIGAIYLKRLNNAARAEEQFRQARRLYAQVEDRREVAETTIDVALCRRALGDLEGALKLLGETLEAAREGSLRETEARALSEVANTRWLRGEYQDALELVGRSNEIAEEIDSSFRLNVNHQLLGLIYWELNQFDRALGSLQRAIEEARRARVPLEVASAHNNRGIVLRRRGDYEEALASFRQALEVDLRLRSRWGQAYDHRNIGMTLHRMGSLEEASGHLESAVGLARQIEDRVNLAKSLLALGELRLDRGKGAEAERLLTEALALSRAIYLPEVEWRALRALGRLRRERGDRTGALEALKEGVEVVEGLRAAIKVEEFQSGFLANKADLYEETVALLLEMERGEEAFLYAERSRARRFIDILAGRSFELKTERERDLYEQQTGLSRRMRALQETIAREDDAERRAELLEELDRLRRRYADVLVDIRILNPALSSFVTVEVADPAELARSLPPEVALAVYYVMEEGAAIWVLRGGQVHVRRAEVSREDLDSAVRAYRLMAQGRELLEEVQSASLGLHRLLVEPIGDLLAGSSTVGIVPHGSLHYLSFASLYDGEAFLVERHALFHGPSASALKRVLEAEPMAAGEELEVLAVGNPAVGNPAYELPFTEREVASIARDFVHVTPLTGERATEDWVKENIARFDVVHIGAHGTLDPLNPLFSSLLLAPKADDGLLHLHEVTGLRVGARLVTLSACQTGVGRLGSADELVSLSRAFSYAGTRSIVSTLWRVDDVSTALVTKHFYRYYVDHGAAESLRHAQLQVLNDGRHRHPNYWAGVVLAGDYR